jgi:hypothetical protein
MPKTTRLILIFAVAVAQDGTQPSTGSATLTLQLRLTVR